MIPAVYYEMHIKYTPSYVHMLMHLVAFRWPGARLTNTQDVISVFREMVNTK